MNDNPSLQRMNAIILILIALIVATAVFNATALVWASQPASSPLEFSPSMYRHLTPVCPGDTIQLSTDFTVRQPAVVAVVASVISESSGLIVHEEPQNDRIRDRKETVRFERAWTVPELPAGKYRRVTAAYGRSLGAEPTFYTVYFNIAQDCAGVNDGE